MDYERQVGDIHVTWKNNLYLIWTFSQFLACGAFLPTANYRTDEEVQDYLTANRMQRLQVRHELTREASGLEPMPLCGYYRQPQPTQSEPCYMCATPVQYVEMVDGEVALPMCAYCNQVVCGSHSFIDSTGYRCCTDQRCKGDSTETKPTLQSNINTIEKHIATCTNCTEEIEEFPHIQQRIDHYAMSEQVLTEIDVHRTVYYSLEPMGTVQVCSFQPCGVAVSSSCEVCTIPLCFGHSLTYEAKDYCRYCLPEYNKHEQF